MKFIINTCNLQSGGALQVALSLLEEWRNLQDHQLHIFLSPQLAASVDQKVFGQHFTFYKFDSNPTSNLWTIFTFCKKLSRLERKIKPDAVLSVFGPALWRSRSPHLVGFANGYYLFDDADFIRAKILTNLLRRVSYFARQFLLFRQLKKEADAYWVETNDAKKKLAEKMKIRDEKISVIGNTYGSSLKNAERKPKSDRRFELLFLSAYYEHKNFEIIPEVIDLLAKKNIDCTIRLSLSPEKFKELFGSSANPEYIKNAGPQDPKELIEIYQNADAVLMPSMLETFSANYPEAMKMQLPIICSDHAFSRNVCGDAALYFDARDAEDIANKIARLVDDKVLQQQLIQAGNNRLQQLETPESRAEKILKLLEQTAMIKNRNS